jgi:hypothetical protein
VRGQEHLDGRSEVAVIDDGDRFVRPTPAYFSLTNFGPGLLLTAHA